VNALPNIVLVHGAWADGSSWTGVIERLQADGYHVTAPQFPLTSLGDDVGRLRQVLEFQDGPVIVAGHSYGGQVLTALGPDAPNVAGLVYIAAFGLDQDESLGALLSQGPVSPALAHLHRRAGIRLAVRGRLREPLCRRRRPRQGKSHVRCAAAPGDWRLR
jgi:pimeloyl-ACP methyl ester carboxylesterase